jgi:cytochrome c oxidase subunit 2
LSPSAFRSPRRRVFALALSASLVGLLAAASLASADVFTPEHGGSPNANEINSLYVITLIIAIVVFVVVEGALFYSLFKFRARKGLVAAQIHGNTRLEVGWTLAAALILVVLTVVTFAKLNSITTPANSGPNGLQLSEGVLAASTSVPNPPNGKKYTICVTGRQYIWRFTYGASCNGNPLGVPYSYTEMVVPAETTIVLDIQSTDVAHSWWIPKLGGKFDAIPGYSNYTWFKSPMPKTPSGDVYRGQCAELCGRNHADMDARVRVLTPTAWEAWLSKQKAYINQANKEVLKDRQALQARGDL